LSLVPDGLRAASRLAAQSFEVLISVMSVLACLAFFLAPESLNGSSVSSVTVEPWTTLWSASYGLAGITTIVGVATGRIGLEAAGVCWLAGAITVQVVAIITVLGWSTLPLLITHLAAIGACTARAWTLTAGHDVAVITRGTP
jgi:hypothetical protein